MQDGGGLRVRCCVFAGQRHDRRQEPADGRLLHRRSVRAATGRPLSGAEHRLAPPSSGLHPYAHKRPGVEYSLCTVPLGSCVGCMGDFLPWNILPTNLYAPWLLDPELPVQRTVRGSSSGAVWCRLHPVPHGSGFPAGIAAAAAAATCIFPPQYLSSLLLSSFCWWWHTCCCCSSDVGSACPRIVPVWLRLFSHSSDAALGIYGPILAAPPAVLLQRPGCLALSYCTRSWAKSSVGRKYPTLSTRGSTTCSLLWAFR